MKTKLMIAGILLIGTSAMAQTPVPSQTQITQTRDFVSSLLNQMTSNDQSTRFSGSHDYAKAGPDLQKAISEKLGHFMDAMNVLASGSFGIAIDQYNNLVKNDSISDQEKAARLEGQFGALQVQLRAATVSYQAALASLYGIEPSWQISHINRWRRGGLKFTFVDGSVVKSKCSHQGDDECKNAVINQQIEKTLSEVCQTKQCQSSMIADYSLYFGSVRHQIDQTLTITLADGKKVEINGTYNAYGYLVYGVSVYSFNTDEFRRLPDRN